MSWFWPDIHHQQQALRATRPAFWASLVVAEVALLSSTLGVVIALPSLVIAAGIRAKNLGAATAGLACVGLVFIHFLYLGLTLTDWEIPLTVAISLPIWGALGAFYLRAMRGLMQYRRASSAEPDDSNLLPLSWGRWGLLGVGLQ